MNDFYFTVNRIYLEGDGCGTFNIMLDATIDADRIGCATINSRTDLFKIRGGKIRDSFMYGMITEEEIYEHFNRDMFENPYTELGLKRQAYKLAKELCWDVNDMYDSCVDCIREILIDNGEVIDEDEYENEYENEYEDEDENENENDDQDLWAPQELRAA